MTVSRVIEHLLEKRLVSGLEFEVRPVSLCAREMGVSLEKSGADRRGGVDQMRGEPTAVDGLSGPLRSSGKSVEVGREQREQWNETRPRCRCAAWR